MKTIEEIKKFFPNHKFEDDFDLKLIQFTAEDLIDFSEEYAKKVAIASLEKASENAKVNCNHEEIKKELTDVDSGCLYFVDKSSIINEENIVL